MEAQEVADRVAIDQLMVSYAEAIDKKDWDRLDTVFTADAHLDYTSSAPGDAEAVGTYADVKKWLQKSLAIFPMTQHMIGKSDMAITGDTAECRTIFHNPMGVPINDDGAFDMEGKGLHVFVVGGWYNDSCVRTADGWKIAKKVEEQGFMQGGFPGM